MFQLGVCLLQNYDNTGLAFAFSLKERQTHFFSKSFSEMPPQYKARHTRIQKSNGSNETLNSNLTAILILGSMFLGATSHCGLANV